LSFTILRCVARTGALVSAVTLTALLPLPTLRYDIPTVEGRSPPGDMQRASGGTGGPISRTSHIMEEYFVSGVAAGQPTRRGSCFASRPIREIQRVLWEPTHRGGNG